MPRPVIALARFSARHRWLVLVTWAVLAVGLLVASRSLGSALEDDLTVPGSDSEVASELIAGLEDEDADASSTSTSQVLVAVDGDVAERATDVGAFAAALGEVEGVTEVTNPLAAAAGDPQAPAAAVTPDGHAVQLRVAAEDDVDVRALREAVDAAREQGLDVGVGYPLLRDLEPGLESRTSELIGIVAAVLVLSVALGSAVAMAVPVASALVGVLSGLAALQLLGHAVSIPTVVPTLATMIGLGVGIDYALFQVARHQSTLRGAPGGQDPDRVEAAAVTAATSGSAVAFAGVTVAVAISALAVTGVDFVSWLGFGTAIVVAVVLLGALTFTPALLAALGPRIARRRGRAATADEGPDEARLDASRWSAFAGWVARHPWVSVVTTTVLLGAMALPATTLTLGQSSDADRPVGTERRMTYDLTTDHLGAGANGSLVAVTTLDPAASGPQDPRVQELVAEVAAVPGVASMARPRLADDGGVVSLAVVATTDPSDEATADVVADLRALELDGTQVHVAGSTAVRLDLSTRIADRLPWLILATVAVAALLLVAAFRSVLLPLKAAVMDLVSVAAAYGVVTAVFEWGWGVEALGLDGPVSIDSYVPMMLFAVLFGLSMDYEVFLLSSVREHWLDGGGTTVAVRRGLAATGGIITAAALIMLAVFGSFVLVDDPTIKVFGVGLAVAVLVDATLVRCVLGPAVMVLLGRRTWWLPRWLDRVLPRVSL